MPSDPPIDQAVGGPAGPAPVRPPHSVRRTSTIDMNWSGGWGSPLQLVGRARDAITHASGTAPIVLATASSEVAIGTGRAIESITVSPQRPRIEELIGSRGGGHLRKALAEVLPGERESGSPLYLLLDDISGTSLIAGFALMRRPDLIPVDADRPQAPDMEGVCIGFAPGSSALVEQRSATRTHRTAVVPSLVNPADPAGWHEIPAHTEVSMRRARRIDVWRDGDVIVIDSAFQDSANDPIDGRVAVHEYLLRATADATSLEIITVEPDPRVLPFIECPSAGHKAAAMVGTPLSELRATVLEQLSGTNGCTHLNDALRALAEVPVLLAQLDRSLAVS